MLTGGTRCSVTEPISVEDGEKHSVVRLVRASSVRGPLDPPFEPPADRSSDTIARPSSPRRVAEAVDVADEWGIVGMFSLLGLLPWVGRLTLHRATDAELGVGAALILWSVAQMVRSRAHN